jgi:hypothetical protein
MYVLAIECSSASTICPSTKGQLSVPSSGHECLLLVWAEYVECVTRVGMVWRELNVLFRELKDSTMEHLYPIKSRKVGRQTLVTQTWM